MWNVRSYRNDSTAAGRPFAAVAVCCLLSSVAGPLAPRPVDGVRVLAVETIAGKSHWNFMRAVLRSLTDAGHAVTVFTPFPDGERDNYTEVDTSAAFRMKLDVDLAEVLEKFVRPSSILPLIVTVSRSLCDAIFQDDRMKAAMRPRADGADGGGDYDVVIVEPMGSECVSHAATVMGLPLVFVVPSPMISHFEGAFLGHVPNPAVVSHFMADHAVPRSFVQRFGNAILLAYSVFAVRYTEWSQKRDAATAPRPYDVLAPVHPSAVFVNSHFATEASRPTPPNFVHVGGLHLEKPKSLPHDILEFINESSNGVIYFTFGSVVKMSTMPDYIQKSFKDALAQVPQRVLWKYEGEMEDVPPNVMIKKWFPQRDILLHPKVKLFISHGGISGVYETVDAGVPVLGFPLFYDQHRNIANLVDAGMAISMELLSVSTDIVLNSILELINNEKYSINAKITSERFKDRPMSPEKLIVYWTEYIHRHKGASHLKSHALNLTWYQYFLLDVIAAILILSLIILFVCYTIIKIIYKNSLKYLYNFKPKSE
ncbi:UDP-glucuronosyltransferase 2C1-like [Rhopalosiphum maidis]|uniref:UDP-glucuronosyltransferase 2C1-like n=1 Tax=Rhopalosiphum maidis TaxID=43146 RepID=UPI000EFE7001|nr:UDP-glucuronosyltransferase 2C1-like [Rhopalosiphum maidis]